MLNYVVLIHSDPNNMNSIVYHLIIERYSTKTLHWYFPWATALDLYNMTGRGEKLQQLHCYHLFSDSLDIYLTKNHYVNYSPKMVPIAKIWGSGSWTITVSSPNNVYWHICQNDQLPVVRQYLTKLLLYKTWGTLTKLTLWNPLGYITTGDPLHSRALAHSRAPLFTQPCPHCSHSRAPGEQWARLCVFTLQGCVQAARLCRGSPVITDMSKYYNMGIMKHGLDCITF